MVLGIKKNIKLSAIFYQRILPTRLANLIILKLEIFANNKIILIKVTVIKQTTIKGILQEDRKSMKKQLANYLPVCYNCRKIIILIWISTAKFVLIKNSLIIIR